MVQTAGQRFFHFGKAIGEIGKDLVKDGELRIILAVDGTGEDGDQIHDAPQSGNLDVGVPDGSPVAVKACSWLHLLTDSFPDARGEGTWGGFSRRPD